MFCELWTQSSRFVAAGDSIWKNNGSAFSSSMKMDYTMQSCGPYKIYWIFTSVIRPVHAFRFGMGDRIVWHPSYLSPNQSFWFHLVTCIILAVYCRRWNSNRPLGPSLYMIIIFHLVPKKFSSSTQVWASVKKVWAKLEQYYVRLVWLD